MQAFADYLAAFNAASDWSEVAPLFEAVFHPEAIVRTPDGEFTRDQWGEMAGGLVAKGASASELEVSSQDEDSMTYSLNVSVGDQVMVMRARATLRDGQIYRVDPIDPDAYSDLVESSK